MKRILIILFLSGVAVYSVNAQLIEDSNRKLRTKKIARKGFFFNNQKKIKKSAGIPISNKKVSLRYPSVSSPFKQLKFSPPRYSLVKTKNKKYVVKTRIYSKKASFKTKKTLLRYSKGSPFRAKGYKISPRYSVELPFQNKKHTIQPKYTGTKIRIWTNPQEWSQSIRIHKSSLWKGDTKTKYRKKGNQHPSSNHHIAMKINNFKTREALRKWNIFWVRLNGNKQNSIGVKKKAKKPKFDKNERVIWNN